jgi:tetratricopeptide (TPR) repeat protein
LALYYQVIGEQQKSLETATKDMQLEDSSAFPYQNQAFAYMYMNRIDEARAVAENAFAKKLDSDSLHFVMFQIAALQNDDAAMKKEIAWAVGKPDDEGAMYSFAAEYDRSRGKLKSAEEWDAKRMTAGKRDGISERDSQRTEVAARTYGLYGFPAEAKKNMSEAGRMPGERFTKCGLAITNAELGELEQAQKLREELTRDFPSDTQTKYACVSVSQALALMHQKQYGEAVTTLEGVRKYDLAFAFSPETFAVMYTRGTAYLAQQDGKSAAADFQKVLDHRTLYSPSEYIPLAQLGLARAYALQGDTGKARTAYQDFFAMWKDADAGIPVMVTAKAEYGKL